MTDQPKRPPGRPRSEDPWCKFVVQLRASDLERLKARAPGVGEASRRVRDLILADLAGSPVAAPPAAKAKAPAPEPFHVEFGPKKSAPSERLKKR